MSRRRYGRSRIRQSRGIRKLPSDLQAILPPPETVSLISGIPAILIDSQEAMVEVKAQTINDLQIKVKALKEFKTELVTQYLARKKSLTSEQDRLPYKLLELDEAKSVATNKLEESLAKYDKLDAKQVGTRLDSVKANVCQMFNSLLGKGLK